jgi:hypothetical protein
MSSSRQSPLADLRLIDDAMTAARSRAKGLTRSETRQILVTELQNRGVMLPPPTVGYYLEELMAGTGPTGSAMRIVKGIASGIKFTSSARQANTAESRARLRSWDIAGTRAVATDPRRGLAEIILDPRAQEVLAVGKRDLVSVWLDHVSSSRVPGSDAIHGDVGPPEESNITVAVFRGDHRIGVLGPGASEAYKMVMRDAADDGVVPVILAKRSHNADGSWRLDLGLPWDR